MTDQLREARCPHLPPQGANINPRHSWVVEANRLCDDPDHRYSDAMHVPVDIELARIKAER